MPEHGTARSPRDLCGHQRSRSSQGLSSKHSKSCGSFAWSGGLSYLFFIFSLVSLEVCACEGYDIMHDDTDGKNIQPINQPTNQSTNQSSSSSLLSKFQRLRKMEKDALLKEELEGRYEAPWAFGC